MEARSDASRNVIRVLVADSNQTQCQLLTSALRRQQRLKVACCRGELIHCLVALRSTHADIAILSGDLVEQDRLLEMIRGIHGEYPDLGLILSLDSYDRELVVKAMRAGARGLFCQASQPFRALCRCISVVHQGQFWANTEQIGYIIEALNSNLRSKLVNTKGEHLLTEREEQIVSFVAEGLTNQAVAQMVNIKANSVKKALLRIYDKLGVTNQVELVLFVLAEQADSSRFHVPPSGLTGSQSVSSAEVACLPTIGASSKIGTSSILVSR